MTDMDSDPQPEAAGHEPRLLKEALGYLTGEGRRQTAADLLGQLRARFREAGREKLSDLVYEMTKACFTVLPDMSVRTLLHTEPRAAELISGELSTMADCLAGVAPKPDLGDVVRRRPSPPAALTDARKCLAALQELEGLSGRQQLALALCHIHEGQPGRAEVVLRALLARPHEDAELLRIAEVNLGFAVLKQRRYAEALPLAEAAIAKAPDNPVPWFNLLAASAELKDQASFERGVSALQRLYARSGSPLIASWIERDLRMLAELLGAQPARIAELLTLPPRSAGGGHPKET